VLWGSSRGFITVCLSTTNGNFRRKCDCLGSQCCWRYWKKEKKTFWNV